ncbi:glycosyltransferase family 4 protein [Erwinia sp. BNK-24-b]|uniref:glycosyltransferase family 4 protein n=1 Tax=Erwinia TaxID=551 RepID=UPI001FEEF417|nr:glycosyltransferase family 4 protein [Erwinia phyllosphaerae]MBV4366632.1 glycosyltransferase family 4 protein [Erwinia phyllosphaerae]
MRVGVSNDNYPEKRTIIVDAGVEYVNFKKKNIYSYINLLNMKFFKKNKIFLFRPLMGSQEKNIDIFHVFNEIAITDRKWVVTFETELPRILPRKNASDDSFDARLKRHSAALMQKNCLALIALSGAAYNLEMKLFQDNPELLRTLREKLVVLHPPQKLYVEERKPRNAANPVHFVFVGRDFYRKGGGEIVRAFDELLNEKKIRPEQIKVTLIGDLNKTNNYAFGKYQDDAAFARETEAAIARYSLFDHHSVMPNDKVMQLLQEADVGLLPTWAETYGFSVLEMQSCGCPVITTNVRALPEINPQEAGWLVKHELNEDCDYAVTSFEQRDSVRRKTVDQMKAIIEDIIQNPEQIVDKANASIARIKNEHDVEVYQDKLRALYNK